jgi:hypothetical protein
MSDPLSWKDKSLAFLATAVLLTTVAKANNADFYYSYSRYSHISGIYPLYPGRTGGSSSEGQTLDVSRDGLFFQKHVPWIFDKDTGWLSPEEERIASKYVRREKNSSLRIVVPFSRARYKIRFFDQQKEFLFEIGHIRDSLLIVEKVNFRHAGLFQYELFKDNMLVEKNSFIIKTDP